MECIVKAPAKINLSLDVVGKRPDGYHLLETIMQAINLFDHITVIVEDNDSEDNIIKITSNIPYIPTNERNTAYKATKIFLSNTKINSKIIKIIINKTIPQNAGLAGGSADAAGVLIALNKLFPNKLSDQKLLNIGERVGADVPFCMTGGTALCEGVGEIITKLPDLPEINILLIKPNFGVSTPWIFKNLKIDNIKKRPDTQKIVSQINKHNLRGLFEHTENVLAQITKSKYPIINKIEEDLISYGASFAMMTGSGSTVYGVFEDKKTMNAAKTALEKKPLYKPYEIIPTRTINYGPKIL